MARIFKALGHPVRIRILQHLQSAGHCKCGDIVKELPLAQSTVSQHLKFLLDAGLITGEAAGAAICYTFNRDLFKQLEESLCHMMDVGGNRR
jgi:DNA-binding transcriptional ArsR family regulator